MLRFGSERSLDSRAIAPGSRPVPQPRWSVDDAHHVLALVGGLRYRRIRRERYRDASGENSFRVEILGFSPRTGVSELEAGDNVLTRDDEYLISMKWLVDHAQSVGFDVLLAEPVNAVGDGIVLLRK
ncbi:hypothetical protein BG842_13420 [Haladaptatus sp. W1]|nr:hypothetical protein BG842_13420 [Haladaptatus sp. W1]